MGISRQRYWGCPIWLIIQNEIVKIPMEDLPVKLPEKINLNTQGNPLDLIQSWKMFQSMVRYVRERLIL